MHNKPFSERFETMGTIAEKACISYMDSKGICYEHIGFDQTPLTTYKMPILLKSLPEFVCESLMGDMFFFECKGCGKDGVLRIKFEDINNMLHWSTYLPVRVFLYNSSTESYSIQNLSAFVKASKNKLVKMNRYENDGNPHIEIPQTMFTWTPNCTVTLEKQ